MCFLYSWFEPQHEKHGDKIKTQELQNIVSDVSTLSKDLRTTIEDKHYTLKHKSCDVLLRKVKTASDNTSGIITRGLRIQKK